MLAAGHEITALIVALKCLGLTDLADTGCTSLPNVAIVRNAPASWTRPGVEDSPSSMESVPIDHIAARSVFLAEVLSVAS